MLEQMLLLVAECRQLRQRLADLEAVVKADGSSLALDELQQEVQELETENAELRQLCGEAADALGRLYDDQNGPPLLKHQDSWNNSMRLTEEVLPKLRAAAGEPHA
jgi:predicted  nucleic acid-binding Zn-ribbon protein